MKQQLIESVDAMGYLIQQNDKKGELGVELMHLHSMMQEMEQTEDFETLVDLHLQCVYYVRRSILNI